MKKRVAILYLHQLWGEALQALINQSDQFIVQELLPLNDETIQIAQPFSVVILETLCPDQSVLKHIQELKKYEQRVLLIGFLKENTLLIDILDAGLDGYVLKSCGGKNLMMALQQVSNEKKYFCSVITEVLNHQIHVQNGNGKNELSAREKEILNSFIDLQTPKQIAEVFNISESTVRTHRKNIMRKVGAKNVLGLLKYACSQGILCRNERVQCTD
ncbi:LuxR C-terminal-related transcriptional regulator [Marinilabilia rubra]|uniref:HTH luxR-type domain-containing protein n=1 Tax=Marinilabilia rubra TaxID=2162893 RepID=A0A2U2BCY7_9BACT|nr:response regulator transcription factor [Marinilabilia rubra]PWE00929.1 hypothetical protein DDZ16_00090 [Marinilabilia rubra]